MLPKYCKESETAFLVLLDELLKEVKLNITQAVRLMGVAAAVEISLMEKAAKEGFNVEATFDDWTPMYVKCFADGLQDGRMALESKDQQHPH